jgi:DNA-binding MarR family transcriptional regulator
MTQRAAEDTTTGEIDGALLSVARVMNQVRVHAKLRAEAGVDIDRAGAAVLYKVQHLEQLGLVVRSPDPVDGRASRLLLTREGKRSIERLLGARRMWLERLLSEWPTADRCEFSRLLALFAATIEEDVEVRHGH